MNLMKQLTLTVIFCFLAQQAFAEQITMRFIASQFPSSNGFTAPTDPVIGTIVWDASSPNATVNSITSITLTIDGHTYSVPTVLYSTAFGDGDIGGNADGSAGGISYLTDDFVIQWNQSTLAPEFFAYASSKLGGIWRTTHFDAFSITGPASAAPVVPATALSLWGLVLLIFTLCCTTFCFQRRKREESAL